jgi:ribosomal protein S12 methylthiotransferase accessory factor
MDILITFPGGKRVDAHFDGVSVATDQPVAVGGTSSAATPFDLFLASLGTCAGYYALAFCQARGLPTEGLRLIEHVGFDPATHLPASIDLELRLPPGFPEQYRAGVVRAAEHCKVRKVLDAPPAIAVHATAPAIEHEARGA